eukprot:scaffold1564_cov389-Prasinococcus_capsulatus_cf.AAC.27
MMQPARRPRRSGESLRQHQHHLAAGRAAASADGRSTSAPRRGLDAAPASGSAAADRAAAGGHAAPRVRRGARPLHPPPATRPPRARAPPRIIVPAAHRVVAGGWALVLWVDRESKSGRHAHAAAAVADALVPGARMRGLSAWRRWLACNRAP